MDYYHLLLICMCTGISIATGFVKDPPICVVGGGISGLRVTKLLQDRGHKVLLFEGNDKFGGKMETHRSHGNAVVLDKGPLIFTPGMKRVSALLKQFSLTPTDRGYQNITYFDPFTGVTKDFPAIEGIPAVKASILKYMKLRKDVENLLAPGYIHPDLLTSDLTLSCMEWLRKNGLGPLIPLASLFTIEGYGALEETPVLYLLKQLNPAFYSQDGSSLISQYVSTKEGLDTLVKGMLGEIETKYENHLLAKVERFPGSSFVVLHFLRKGLDLKTVNCSKAILAFPPILTKVVHMMDDLSREELQILDQIKVSKYASAGVSIEEWDEPERVAFLGNLNGESGKLVGTIGRGEITSALRSRKGTRPNTFTTYSWIHGEFDSGLNREELALMTRRLKSFLHNLSGGKRNEIFYGPQGYDYFPRVSGQSIKNGFYGKLKAIQGKGGVYYATPLLTFELIEACLEMAESFVQDFF